ncbi:hypothetical protein LVD17_25710 [Fulvivirga ulvae]|uniref:hypothetical protein n=1 Tax=Fulvivirga ulvae TaxID=2904245 RepID=UPI001F20DA5B|nr:hypothetical protein [Fulvivirga ulvae]UII31690.1 hypothetical protein LVD17_25710 [Fulvivirga ulvae]
MTGLNQADINRALLSVKGLVKLDCNYPTTPTRNQWTCKRHHGYAAFINAASVVAGGKAPTKDHSTFLRAVSLNHGHYQ